MTTAAVLPEGACLLHIGPYKTGSTAIQIGAVRRPRRTGRARRRLPGAVATRDATGLGGPRLHPTRPPADADLGVGGVLCRGARGPGQAGLRQHRGLRQRRSGQDRPHRRRPRRATACTWSPSPGASTGCCRRSGRSGSRATTPSPTTPGSAGSSATTPTTASTSASGPRTTWSRPPTGGVPVGRRPVHAGRGGRVGPGPDPAGCSSSCSACRTARSSCRRRRTRR